MSSLLQRPAAALCEISCSFAAPASQLCGAKSSRVTVCSSPAVAAPIPTDRPSLERPTRRPVSVCAASQPPTAEQSVTLPSLAETTAISATSTSGALPATPGVYAVYDKQGTLQYIGLSRKVAASVATHAQTVPELTHEVKAASLPIASKELLTAAWKAWLQEAVSATGTVPPGNAQGNTSFAARARAKPEIKLTPGKGAQDVTVPMSQLIDAVVKSNKVVAFIKGTRTQPQCGFSHRVMTLLNELRANYEVVNVLDDLYNPGLREAIKEFSQWPTIPQVYIGGEFVGGADVLEEMQQKGELKSLLSGS